MDALAGYSSSADAGSDDGERARKQGTLLAEPFPPLVRLPTPSEALAGRADPSLVDRVAPARATARAGAPPAPDYAALSSQVAAVTAAKRKDAEDRAQEAAVAAQLEERAAAKRAREERAAAAAAATAGGGAGGGAAAALVLPPTAAERAAVTARNKKRRDDAAAAAAGGSARPTGKDRVKAQRLAGQSGIGEDFKVWRSEEEMKERQGYD